MAEKVGLRTQAERDFYDLAIVGAGPAGLAGAVYGASEGLNRLRKNSESMAKGRNLRDGKQSVSLADRSWGILARSFFHPFRRIEFFRSL
ncbi:MAG: hypothetical protein ACYCPO_16190 [Acidobacteriaceae bacterium]